VGPEYANIERTRWRMSRVYWGPFIVIVTGYTGDGPLKQNVSIACVLVHQHFRITLKCCCYADG